MIVLYDRRSRGEDVQTGCTFEYIKLYFCFFCYYAKYGRVRGPGSRKKSPKLPDEGVLERHKINFLVIVMEFCGKYNYYFRVNFFLLINCPSR